MEANSGKEKAWILLIELPVLLDRGGVNWNSGALARVFSASSSFPFVFFLLASFHHFYRTASYPMH